MNGVTIKQEITEREVDKTTLVVVLAGVALAIALAVATTIKHAMAGNVGLVLLAILAGVAMIGYARDMWRAYNNTWSEYMVEVGDSVSLNEFSEKYEIVADEGEGVYMVRELGD